MGFIFNLNSKIEFIFIYLLYEFMHAIWHLLYCIIRCSLKSNFPQLDIPHVNKSRIIFGVRVFNICSRDVIKDKIIVKIRLLRILWR